MIGPDSNAGAASSGAAVAPGGIAGRTRRCSGDWLVGLPRGTGGGRVALRPRAGASGRSLRTGTVSTPAAGLLVGLRRAATVEASSSSWPQPTWAGGAVDAA